ncbi:YihY/virulence factor BrkB family protein [Granulicella tundricola]|nr:YihY/virulence factor BrkB family protein [Granulicella tundricola]
MSPTPGNTSAKLDPSHSDAAPVDPKDHRVGATHPLEQHIWDRVSSTPLHNLWDFQGASPLAIAKRTFHSFNEDNLLSRAAELGYYFLFALFPTLITASAILGLVVRNSTLYLKLLNYLALVVPADAFKLVLETFTQTTTHSSGSKLIFGLAAGLWSASVGFSAIQDTLNIVYKVKETRPYWKVKGAAILVTVLLSIIVILILGSMFTGSFVAHWLYTHIAQHQLALAVNVIVRFIAWSCAALLCVLLFAVIYYFAPDVKNKHWRWFTPGAAVGIGGWVLASVILRVYLHYFNSYSVTYGSLGAVIILLTWFYMTGLMLLTGAEMNSEIEAAAAECCLKAEGKIPEQATTDASAPIRKSA